MSVRPGLVPLNVSVPAETRNWVRKASRDLRLTNADIVRIAVNMMKEHIDTHGNADFLPIVTAPGSEDTDLIPAPSQTAENY